MVAGRIGSVLVGTALALASAVPAAGQTAPPSPLYGVAAGPAAAATDQADQFSYAVAAGSSLEDSVVVSNYSGSPLTLSLYAADVHSADGGGLAPAQSGDTMVGVGAWLLLDAPTITVPARGVGSSRFRLAVPAGTPPGDYVGAVVTALDHGPTDDGLGLETRVARMVRLRVPGEVRLGVEVSRPATRRRGAGMEFEVVVRNIGNVLFRTSGAMVVRRDGDEVASPALGPGDIYVVPGGQVALNARWPDLPLFGAYSARAEIAVVVGDDAPARFVGPAAGIRLFPWTAALATGTAALLAAAFFIGTRRPRAARRRRRREERAVLAEFRATRSAGSVDR